MNTVVPGFDPRYVNTIFRYQVKVKEATEFEGARGRNHVAGRNIYSFCTINTQLH